MAKSKRQTTKKDSAQSRSETDARSDDNDWCEDCQCSHKPSQLTNEWYELSKRLKGKELLKYGLPWLKRNKLNVEAGSAIAELITLKPTASLLAIGDAWLRQYPDDGTAIFVVAAMLPVAPSRMLYRLAGEFLDEPERLLDVYGVAPLMWAVFKSRPHAALYAKIEKLIIKFPNYLHWQADFRQCGDARNSRLDALHLWYMRQNVDNPKLEVLPSLLFDPSIEILEASLNWMKAGGRKYVLMTILIRSLLEASAKHEDLILPRALRFARMWAKANAENQRVGAVHAAIISTTKSSLDVRRAKQWHQLHKSNESTSAVLAAILEQVYQGNRRVDLYVVNEAKLLLRDESIRRKKPHLVSALIAAHPDAESIAWAWEEYRRLRPLPILMRLLNCAPNKEALVAAEFAFDRWKDHESLEPEMLAAILHADPKNKLALRRAKVWQKRDPKNKWMKAIRHYA